MARGQRAAALPTIDALTDVALVGAMCPLADRKRALVERLGLGVAALGPVERTAMALANSECSFAVSLTRHGNALLS
jgi:hypothetical protein